MVLETKILALGMLTAAGMSLLLGPFGCQSKKIYVPRYIHISINISVSIYLYLY